MDNQPAIQLITAELIDSVTAQARASARQRKNYNFHSGDRDNPHRFLNVFLKGSYVRPHRHLRPPKAESFVVLSGHMVALVFDDSGAIAAAPIRGGGPHAGEAPWAPEEGSGEAAAYLQTLLSCEV